MESYKEHYLEYGKIRNPIQWTKPTLSPWKMFAQLRGFSLRLGYKKWSLYLKVTKEDEFESRRIFEKEFLIKILYKLYSDASNKINGFSAP